MMSRKTSAFNSWPDGCSNPATKTKSATIYVNSTFDETPCWESIWFAYKLQFRSITYHIRVVCLYRQTSESQILISSTQILEPNTYLSMLLRCARCTHLSKTKFAKIVLLLGKSAIFSPIWMKFYRISQYYENLSRFFKINYCEISRKFQNS